MDSAATENTPVSESVMGAVHARLAAAAAGANAKSVLLKNTVSSHALPCSASFPALWKMLSAVDAPERIRVGTASGKLIVSYTEEAPPNASKKKRGRSAADEVSGRTSKLRETAKNDPRVTNQMLCDAEAAMTALLDAARGEAGESVVQSWGIAAQKDESEPALVLSARISGGCALSLAKLKTALGPRASADGMLTISEPDPAKKAFCLPLSACGKVAEERGVKSFLLFASLAQRATPSPTATVEQKHAK